MKRSLRNITAACVVAMLSSSCSARSPIEEDCNGLFVAGDNDLDPIVDWEMATIEAEKALNSSEILLIIVPSEYEGYAIPSKSEVETRKQIEQNNGIVGGRKLGFTTRYSIKGAGPNRGKCEEQEHAMTSYAERYNDYILKSLVRSGDGDQ